MAFEKLLFGHFKCCFLAFETPTFWWNRPLVHPHTHLRKSHYVMSFFVRYLWQFMTVITISIELNFFSNSIFSLYFYPCFNQIPFYCFHDFGLFRAVCGFSGEHVQPEISKRSGNVFSMLAPIRVHLFTLYSIKINNLTIFRCSLSTVDK